MSVPGRERAGEEGRPACVAGTEGKRSGSRREERKVVITSNMEELVP